EGAFGWPSPLHAHRHRRGHRRSDAAVRGLPSDSLGVRRRSRSRAREPHSKKRFVSLERVASAAIRPTAALTRTIRNDMLPTIARQDDVIVMIDQRKLPVEEVYVRCKTAAEVARAIKTMVIRGAPAIGVAAAMGIALGMRKSKATGTQKFAAEFYRTCELMTSTRPTAVNLFWAIERMKRSFAAAAEAGASVDQIKDRLDLGSAALHAEDV